MQYFLFKDMNEKERGFRMVEQSNYDQQYNRR